MPSVSPIVTRGFGASQKIVTQGYGGVPAIVEEAGGCNAPGSVAPLTGAANTLMMLSPLMLIGAYKGMKFRKKRLDSKS